MPRQAELKLLNVVAGILRDGQGRVLITERLEDGPFQGMWEFPGGKIGASETPQAALERELSEEIGVVSVRLEPFMSLEHRYPDRHVSIEFFFVDQWQNEPQGLEGQGIKWVTAGELSEQNLLPADVPVIDALQQILS